MEAGGIEQVSAAEWQRWVAEHDAVVVDVREPEEWAMGVLPGSERISLASLATVLDRFDRSCALLMVCRSGNRSQVAARFLAANGFARVANLAGGVRAAGVAA